MAERSPLAHFKARSLSPMSRPFSNCSSPYKRTGRKNTADKLHFFCVSRAVFPESVRLFRVTLNELREMHRIRICPWIIGLFCGLFSSCLEDIDLDTGERILSVHCILDQGPEQELELSYIAPTGGTSSPVGDDVTISLYDEGASVGLFSRVSETKWHMNFSPQGGHAYKLEVIASGHDTLTAETRFPIPCFLQYVQMWEKNRPPINPYNTLFLGFELESPEDQTLWCYFEHRNRADSHYEDISFYPQLQILDRELSSAPFADFIATDHPGVDGRGETLYPTDWTKLVDMEDFDRNRWSFSMRLFSDELFGEQTFYHETALRIHHPAGFSRQYDNDNMNRKLFRSDRRGNHPDWKEEIDNTSMFSVAVLNKTTMIGNLVLRSVSDEYDKYLSEYYYGDQDTADFTKFVYKRNYYSNVRNGTGIFGASVDYGLFQEWPLPYFSDLIMSDEP